MKLFKNFNAAGGVRLVGAYNSLCIIYFPAYSVLLRALRLKFIPAFIEEKDLGCTSYAKIQTQPSLNVISNFGWSLRATDVLRVAPTEIDQM